VRDLVDVLVLLLQPETGDDLQWEKAGLLEVADVVVIHKADMPGTERVESQVLSSLGLSAAPAPPVLRVSARSGEGLDRLWEVIASAPLRRGARASARELLRRAQEEVAARFAAAERGRDSEWQSVIGRWQRGELQTEQAAAALLHLLGAAQPDNARKEE
jgi:LAO/AO transport system kinase